MEKEKGPERFQPRIVASFSKIQLLKIYLWSKKNVTQTGLSFTRDFLKTVETVEFDERGKKMDGKAKNRLIYGEKVISDLLNYGHQLDQIQGVVTVWQLTPDKDKLEVRWKLTPTDR